MALSKCVDKTVLSNTPNVDIEKKNEKTKQEQEAEQDGNDDLKDSDSSDETDDSFDLEDRVYIEIVRKLRGDDEDIVVKDYMNELCDIYKIDLHNENKYQEIEEDSVDDDNNDGTDDSATSNGNNTVKPQFKKNR